MISNKPDKPLRVDILCEFSSLNGGENSMLVLLPLLERRGIDFRILAPPRGALAETVRMSGVKLIPFDIAPGMPLTRRQEILYEILKRTQPDILHANSLSAGRLAGSVIAGTGLRGIVHLRDIIKLNQTSIAGLNCFSRSLAVSEATRQFHLAQGLNSDTCYVMHNGVDLQKFHPAPTTGYLHRELNIPRETKLLAVIGQIGLRKGQDELLEILVPIFERRNDVHLLIVGRRWSEKAESIQFEQNLRNRSEKYPFQNRVHFLDIRTDIPQLLNELTLLVHPARQEPLGRVLLEAAACGVAVVATDVGGTREIFPGPESAGIVSRTVSGEAFGEIFGKKIENLLDSDAGKKLGIAARRRAETAFSHETVAENLYRHYSEVYSE